MKEDYPLYIAWQAVMKEVIDLCAKYPKHVRFSVCDRLMALVLDVMESLIEAIYTKDKLRHLDAINIDLEKIRALIQISFQSQYISIKQYESISHKLHVYGKGIGGWRRKCTASDP